MKMEVQWEKVKRSSKSNTRAGALETESRWTTQGIGSKPRSNSVKHEPDRIGLAREEIKREKEGSIGSKIFRARKGEEIAEVD